MKTALVVEHLLFDKLTLIDLLSLFEYEVEAVETAEKALECLRTGQKYDIVLVDISIPDMGGIQCLEKIKRYESLENIPVVIIIESESEETFTACLSSGAKDCLIKPVKISALKKLLSYKTKDKNETKTVTTRGLENYEEVKILSYSGKVYLEKCLNGEQAGHLFVMRKIYLLPLTPAEIKQIENEHVLLKILDSPSFLKYHDSFKDINYISVIMEYAEGGSLSERLKILSKNKRKLNVDIILNWIAQVTLGLLTMYNKCVMHGNICTEALYLSKLGEEEVLKIGNMEIPRKSSDSSSLYKLSFLSPEIICGGPSSYKSEMWALGCVFYELATLEKPFSGRNVTELVNEIKTKNLTALPTGVDPLIQSLILSLLNKDPSKRPSIQEFAQMPEIKQRINLFTEKYTFISTLSKAEINPATIPYCPLEEEKTTRPTEINCDQLDELIMSLKEKFKEEKIESFTISNKYVKGRDLANMIISQYGYDIETTLSILNRLMKKGKLISVKNLCHFENSDTAYYQFQNSNIAANMVIPVAEFGNPLIVSADLLSQITNIYQQVVKKAKENSFVIDLEELNSSLDFYKYQILCAVLQATNLSIFDKKERMMFFLNIYQCMYVHYLFLFPPTNDSKKLSLTTDSSVNFSYNIGGINYTLGKVKSEILCKQSDPIIDKLPEDSFLVSGKNDCRMLFLTPDYPEAPSQFAIFKKDCDVQKLLEDVAQKYINSSVSFEETSKKLILPEILKTYNRNFARTEEDLVKWVWKYCNKFIKFAVENVLAEISKKLITIQYVVPMVLTIKQH